MSNEVVLKLIEEAEIDKIIEVKDKLEESGLPSFFEENIKNKSKAEISEVLNKYDDIVEVLLTEDTTDDGGIIAVSGFYFQFLVSIEYLVGLIKGEWDYVFIDHHQDIIALNAEKIRFIQVKTKNVPYADVSDTGTYKDWIQKLFILDKIFQGYKQKREFELVTNFIIKNSRDVEGVEIYRGNDSYNMPIQINSFFEKVKEFSGKKEEFKVLLEETYLQDLLSKFKITSKDTEGYVHKISSLIGSLFSDRIKGTKEDIDFLIGHICSVCYYPKNPSVQLIDKEKSLRIVEELRSRVGSDVREYVKNEDSLEKINDYIEYLHSAFHDSPLYFQLAPYISDFEEELKENIKQNNNIYNIMSRFIDRVYSSYKFGVSKKDTMGKYIKELLDLTFLLKLSSGGKVTIDYKNSSLLLKIIGNDKYNFFNLKDFENLANGIGKFKDAIKISEFEENRRLFDKGILNLIFSGDFDDDEFPREYVIELDISDNPTKEDMESIGLEVEQESISKVTHKVHIKNGSNTIKTKILRKRMSLEFDQYKEFIQKELG